MLIAALPSALVIALAFLPSRWALLCQGIYWLGAGLLWLDRHGQPFGEDNDRLGLGASLFVVWVCAGLVGTAIATTRHLIRGPKSKYQALWPLPVGILFGVLLLHWLSNRLAGATPAWLLHVLVTFSGVMIAGIVWSLRRRSGLGRDLHLVAATGSITVAALVAWAALDAFRWVARAHAVASGAPYCLLTFAGREHPRGATSVFELSPLVSRSGGRSFIDDAHWLVIAKPTGTVAKRWRAPWPAPGYFEDKPAGAPCRLETTHSLTWTGRR